jgi:transposase
MAKATNYTPEYKKEIIKLVTEQGKNRGEVAQSIGVSKTTINEWIKKWKMHSLEKVT